MDLVSYTNWLPYVGPCLLSAYTGWVLRGWILDTETRRHIDGLEDHIALLESRLKEWHERWTVFRYMYELYPDEEDLDADD